MALIVAGHIGHNNHNVAGHNANTSEFDLVIFDCADKLHSGTQ